MALYTTPDGRVIIGTGVSDGNDYHGYNGKRDIVIQLTEDGATDDGLNALEYLKSYAENAKAENKPIFPDGTRVFISANGYTKAVEADDVVIDGDNITIGGIVWNGSAWDYSGAGQIASSLPEVDSEDNGKVLTVVDGEWNKANAASGLPTPTSSDVGKVATVVETYDKGTSVAEQETYEFYYNHDIFGFANSDFESLADAETVIVTIDGTDYTANVSHGVASVSIDRYTYTITANTKDRVVTCLLTGLEMAEHKTSTIAVYLVANVGYAWDMATPSTGGGVLVINAIEDGAVWVLDKTWQEIFDNPAAVIIAQLSDRRKMVEWVGNVMQERDDYYVNTISSSQYFSCESPDAYPHGVID